MQKIAELQYLRALAVVWVVLAHASGRYGPPWVRGVAGVDLFFVISGFMMVLITNQTTRPLSFAVDRLTRVAPMYWMVTTIVLLGAFFGLFPRMVLEPGYILKSYLFIPAKSPASEDVLPLVAHGWTLNYEILFYAIFTAALLVPDRLRTGTLLLVLAGFVALGIAFDLNSLLLREWTKPILLEFAAGAFVGRLWRVSTPRSMSWGLVLVVSGAGMISLVPCSESSIRVIYFGIPSVFILCGALLLRGFVVNSRVFQILENIGNASYSIYLWHGLVISIFVAMSESVGLRGGLGVTLATLVCLGVGYLIHVCIEKPMLSRTRALIKPAL